MKIVVLTGAGMSAESGISTFRDQDGLWEKYKIEDVATIDGWRKNPSLVLDFYNKRRQQLKDVEPNDGHKAIASWQSNNEVIIITQNVDDLHERAGSENVLHLHGELRKVRSSTDPQLIYTCEDNIFIGDLCEKKSQLRPHIVWFGEEVPALEEAAAIVEKADRLVIVGTSLQVYPAAGLYMEAPHDIPFAYIDPKPQLLEGRKNAIVFSMKASEGLRLLTEEWGL
jgi:NAD-dependent SIR2 family protein deacetylase